jgi:hypothetical protein
VVQWVDLPFEPRRGTLTTFPGDDEECRKQLLAELLRAPAVIEYDNLTSDLGPVNTNQRIHDKREVNEELEYNIQFIEPREDTTKALEAAKQAFYLISFLVWLFVILPFCQAIAF